jgi:hypothetical protein
MSESVIKVMLNQFQKHMKNLKKNQKVLFFVKKTLKKNHNYSHFSITILSKKATIFIF